MSTILMIFILQFLGFAILRKQLGKSTNVSNKALATYGLASRTEMHVESIKHFLHRQNV